MPHKPPIDRNYLLGFLQELLEIPSPTGFTDQIVRFCARELDRLGVNYELTRRGAIRAVVPGRHRHPARALISHLDTLGAQVKDLKDNGRLELVPVGHWSARFAEGARCTIFTYGGTYRGTILPLKASGHTYGPEIDEQPVSWSQVELRIDAEIYSRQSLADHGFGIGDFVAIDPQPEFMENGYIVSRHLDDKAGVAAMFAALKAILDSGRTPAVDTYFLFSIAEEVGVGASSVLHGDIAAMVTIDNGTTAPGQNSREFGVTIAMADSSGPFDYHLTKKLIDLCATNGIVHQRDIFRHYRCDSASALEAGNDIRTALITFGIDASHGYERIHQHALLSIAELIALYSLSPVEVKHDRKELTPGITSFTEQPMAPSDDAAVETPEWPYEKGKDLAMGKNKDGGKA
ncbi:MAG: osmoprotectant NAGGN system M42 family peptidase [Alphaproteobacteria bacterium]|nr:MAG: osmoprotectant NAGGN system M42 family peptidase [Alphaproteobacteria bacterium]